jgi:ribosomal-protein-alanine N-acetyltransferase
LTNSKDQQTIRPDAVGGGPGAAVPMTSNPASALQTARLKLIPATVALARAEIGDRTEFTRLLEATVPDNWPPESLADALPLFLSWLEAAPDQVGWFGWYAVTVDRSVSPVLAASGGFMGPPTNGVIEIGYSVLTQFQGRGYATELVEGLVGWALRQPGVVRIAAETEWANPASVRVLTKAGFTSVGLSKEQNGSRFEYSGGR